MTETEKLKAVAEACGYEVNTMGLAIIVKPPDGPWQPFDPLADCTQAVACLRTRFARWEACQDQGISIKGWRTLKAGSLKHFDGYSEDSFGDAAVAAILASVEDDDA